MQYLKLLTEAQAQTIIVKREAETKLGEKISFLSSTNNLEDALGKSTCKFVLLGIPEDLGVQANYGKPGTSQMWSEFLKKFLNIQSNKFIEAASILCLGEIDFSDLYLEAKKNSEINNLRLLVSKIDERVYEYSKKIISSGKIPILIGGGHNNSFPLLKALSAVHANAIDCINIDAHADLRKLEGRHSGNGFSYAHHEGYLKNYFVLGLHENYCSEYLLQQFETNKEFNFITYDELLKSNSDLDQFISKSLNHLKNKSWSLEVDLDSISGFPSSAESQSGFTLDQMRYLITEYSKKSPDYVHFCEGIPGRDAIAAKSLAYLVSDFIKNYSKKVS